MKNNDINRPRVTRVKVTVKSPGTKPPSKYTDIELIADSEIDESNFDYYPVLIFNKRKNYFIDQANAERTFGPNKYTVTYKINGRPLKDYPVVAIIDVAVEVDVVDYEYCP